MQLFPRRITLACFTSFGLALAPAAVAPLANVDEPELQEEERVNVDIPAIPPPGKQNYVQFNAALDTAFVIGSEFGGTKVNDTYASHSGGRLLPTATQTERPSLLSKRS